MAKDKTPKTAPAADATATAKPAAAKNLGPKGVSDDAAVKMLAGSNPKREGSAARARFANYRDGMTVKEALAAGITTPDLVYDAKHGFIEIAGYTVPGGVVVPKPKAPPKPKAEKAGKKEKAVKSPEQVALEQAADAEAKEETM